MSVDALVETSALAVSVELGEGTPELADAYLEQPLGPLRVRLGRMKKPSSRQRLTSSGKQQLLERAATDELAGAGRDVGVLVHGGPGGVLEWAIGVVNGPKLVARAGVSLGGIRGYSESDLEGGELRIAAAVSTQLDPDASVHHVVADAIVKLHGASFTYAMVLRVEAGGEPQLGFHAQAGHLVVPRQLELAARVADVPAAGGGRERELLGGVTWFIRGHAWKITVEGGTVLEPTRTRRIARAQAQLAF